MASQYASVEQSELFTMDSVSLYEDEADRQRHRHVMEAMAQELHRPIEEIEQFYEEALLAMAAKARVRDYLPIFISKSVKRSLSGTSSSR